MLFSIQGFNSINLDGKFSVVITEIYINIFSPDKFSVLSSLESDSSSC